MEAKSCQRVYVRSDQIFFFFPLGIVIYLSFSWYQWEHYVMILHNPPSEKSLWKKGPITQK